MLLFHDRPGPRSRKSTHATAIAACILITAALLAAGSCNALRFGAPLLTGAPPMQELLLTLSPIDLAPRVDHAAAGQPVPLHATFPHDGWVHGFTVEVTGSDSMPYDVLHHIKLLVPGRRELFSPIALRLVGAGAETKQARVPRSIGVPLQRGDSLLLTAMVHNPTELDLKGVRVRLRVHYTPAAQGYSPVPVYPFFLHVTPPVEPSSYDLPPGTSERSWEARPAVGGHVVAFGGHLHRFGVALRIEDVTDGRVLWRSSVRADTAGTIIEVPRTTYFWSNGVRLRADHTYRVTATYHNPTQDTIHDGGMGTVGGVFRPDAEWPAADPGNDLRARDLARELGSVHAHAHHH